MKYLFIVKILLQNQKIYFYAKNIEENTLFLIKLYITTWQFIVSC